MLRTLAAELSAIRDAAEAQADDYRARTSKAQSDRDMAIVLLSSMLCLLSIRYFGSPDRPEHVELALRFFSPAAADAFTAALHGSALAERVYWAACRLLFYGLVPLACAKWLLRRPLATLGLSHRGLRKQAKVYLGILVLLAPVVVAASFGEAFQRKYPYYQLAAGEPLWPRFWAWELLYAAQFLALEFFFRGFLLHGLVPRFGFGAVPVMMVPYMMIHYGKPLPETLGSIVAGFVLGTLSLKSRSVYWGAVVHVCVACGMDLLSLWQRGLLSPR